MINAFMKSFMKKLKKKYISKLQTNIHINSNWKVLNWWCFIYIDPWSFADKIQMEMK